MSSNITATPALTCSKEAPFNDKNFPSRLYRFLEMVDTYDISHIVSWQPHGRCFRIHNPNEFVNLKEPSWFEYSKYSSFQRQLNIYGFTRITNGDDKSCYFHKHFLRGQEHLLHKIIRVPTKKDAPQIYRASTQAEDSKVTPSESNSSSTVACARLPLTPLSFTIPPELNVEQRIELLRQINSLHGNHIVQLDDAARTYCQLLLNTNLPIGVTSAPQQALLSRLLQDQTSACRESDLSLGQSQLGALITSSLPLRFLNLSPQPLNFASSTAAACSQNDQLRMSLQDSHAAFRTNVALPLQQQELLNQALLNQARGLMYDQLYQLPPSNPFSVNPLPSAAATNLQNHIIEQQLNRYKEQRLLDAISSLRNMGSGLVDSLMGPNGGPASDNFALSNIQQNDRQSTTDSSSDTVDPHDIS